MAAAPRIEREATNYPNTFADLTLQFIVATLRPLKTDRDGHEGEHTRARHGMRGAGIGGIDRNACAIAIAKRLPLHV